MAVLLEASQRATPSESVPVELADAGVENVNAQVDALIDTGVLRRLLVGGRHSRLLTHSRRHGASRLLRDRDAIYGDAFRRRITSMGIDEVMSSPYGPWQNPFVERVIGSISTRVPGPRDRGQRAASAPAPDRVSHLLSCTSRLAAGRAHAATRADADGRVRGRVPGTWRTTSSLRGPRRLTGLSRPSTLP